VIGYFFLIIYNLVRFIKHNFLFSTGPLFNNEMNSLKKKKIFTTKIG
jgi:hypothetical protein